MANNDMKIDKRATIIKSGQATIVVRHMEDGSK